MNAASAKAHTGSMPKPKPFKIAGPGLLGGAVPDWAAASFATFEQPRAASIPRGLARLFVPKPLPRLQEDGVDYHEARQLDVANRRFYLVPGRKAICLFYFDGDRGAAACLPNGPLGFPGGVSFELVPPPTSKQLQEWVRDRSKPYPTAGPVVTIGVAPRGVTQVLLHGTDGQERLASQLGEGYVGALKNYIVRRTFSGPGIAPYDNGPGAL